ncbi:Cytochrome P450 monooxygenase mpaDE [Penicillium rolfsii]|nr:Cytochrome P450 monooxygenase mpaDE [Penicillium rolfsii]
MITISFAALCLGVFLVFQIIRVERRLSTIPGPFIARFTDYWKVYHLLKGDWGETLHWWHQHHGSLIRTGPRHISVGDATEVPRVYQIKPLLHKGSMYKAVIGWYKGKNVAGLEGMVDEVEHAKIKRVIVPSFSWKSVLQYESNITDTAEELICHLEKKDVIDITEWIAYWSIDSMNNIAFSTSLGFMKRGEDVGGTLSTIRSVTGVMMWVSAFPTVFMWFAWAMSLVVGPSGKMVSLCMDRVNARVEQKEAVEEKPSPSKADLLDVYIEARREQPNMVSHERLIGMTFTTILAGSDSTGLNLQWTLYYFLKSPACLRRLQEEIDGATLEGKISYPPTLQSLSSLPYLEAVIKEGLRYALLLQLTMDRIVPKGGMDICGYNIPEGMTVGCQSRVIHFDKSVYGEDAESFRPERWIEASPEQRKLMDRCGIWFGSGKHTCLGQHFARAKTMKLLAMMLMRFELIDHDPNAKMVSGAANSTRDPTNSYFMKLKKRDSSPEIVM